MKKLGKRVLEKLIPPLPAGIIDGVVGLKRVGNRVFSDVLMSSKNAKSVSAVVSFGSELISLSSEKLFSSL